MSLIRDYNIIGLSVNSTTVLNATGTLVAVRKADVPSKVLLKVFDEVNGGKLLAECTLSSGEKIRTETFKRVEITNVDGASSDIVLTIGSGNYESDIVEGQVTILGNVDSKLSPSTIEGGQIAFGSIGVMAVPSGTYRVLLVNNTDAPITVSGFPLVVGGILEFDSSESYTLAGAPTTGTVDYLYTKYV